jgi:Ras-related protein Ral-A
MDLTDKRKVSKREAELKAKSWGCEYIETSAKTRQNVEDVFDKIMRQIRDRKAASQPKDSGEKKEGCCTIL